MPCSEYACVRAQVAPSDSRVEEEGSGDEVTKERARMASQLADAKKKFMAVAKRKQQDYNKKVNREPFSDLLLLLGPWLRPSMGCVSRTSNLRLLRDSELCFDT